VMITLTRDAEQHLPYCTLGKLEVPPIPAVFETIEKPWIPHPGTLCGEQQKSCIGKGTYTLERRETDARGRHWILSNPELGVYRQPREVPAGEYARSLILIHAANWAHELLGCIAPGIERAVMEGEQAVTSSRQAMLTLHNLLDSFQDLTLEIA
jgi:hypothetical protein